MADANTTDQNDRVNLVYETKIGDKSEMVELPFKVLIIGDFTLDERSEYFDEQVPILLNQQSHEIDVLFQQLRPQLKINVPNKIQSDDTELLIELNFSSLNDFKPDQVLTKISWMGKLLEFTDTLAQASDIDNFELNENMLVGLEYRYKTSISGALYDTMASHSGIRNFGYDDARHLVESVRAAATAGSTAAEALLQGSPPVSHTCVLMRVLRHITCV